MEKYCAILCICLSIWIIQSNHGLIILESDFHLVAKDDSSVQGDSVKGLLDEPLENIIQMNDLKPIVSKPVVEEIPDDYDWTAQLNKRRNVPERGFTEETKKKILDLHNLYRGNVTPPAGNMAFLEWDERLEHLAQLWADGCVFAHGKPPNTSYPGPYGQNLYIGTDPTGYKGLWLWYEEYLHYDLREQYCKPNEQCGHYIQMAWSESVRLGCGVTKCGLRYLIVCHYYPAALRGQQMYIVAKPCSQCSNEEGALCLKNLCMTKEQCERNPEICKKATCNLRCHNCGRLNKSSCQCTCADGWDSPDCSHLCQDEHERCGVNPGFPSKASCSVNRHAVAKKYCRKMCESCNPYLNYTKVNHICCEGRLCEKGYVLDLDRKICRCNLLCPGPYCDILEGRGSTLKVCFMFIIAQILTFNFLIDFNPFI